MFQSISLSVLCAVIGCSSVISLQTAEPLSTNARNPNPTQPLRHCTSSACTCTAYSILASRLRSQLLLTLELLLLLLFFVFIYLFIQSVLILTHRTHIIINNNNCLHRFSDALGAASPERAHFTSTLIRSIVDVSNFVAVVVEFFLFIHF